MYSFLFWCLPSYLETSQILEKPLLQTRDLFFKIRRMAADPPPRLKDIVIVSIDSDSCDRLEARWPWSRRIFAKMIRELHAKGARIVGLNVSFTGLEEGGDASSRELGEAMREHGRVVIGATSDNDRLVKPSPLIAEGVARFGYLEKIVDADFAIRQSYLLRLYSRGTSSTGAAFASSFPLQLLASDRSESEITEPHFDADLGLLTVGRPTLGVYLNPDGSYPINYVADDGDFKTIPAWKVVQGKIAEEEVRDKVVLVGLTGSVFGDTHPTPLGILPGIAIHANEYLALSSGRELRFVPDWATFALSWAAAVCVLLLFLFRRLWLGVFGFVIAAGGLFLGAQAAFAKDFVIEPFILMLGPFTATVAGVLSNSAKLLLENKGLETKVIHDKMTGLYKYEYLRECLEEEWRRCKRGNLPVSVVMTDLDRFKKINDTLGHETGNDMIRRAGAVIKESARRYDIVSRYGGDEFVVLLWHANLEEAKAYRQRLRDAYHQMAGKLEDPLLKESSISIGVASFDPAVDPKYPPDTQRLVEDADKDLFLDKESRRKPGEARR
ncbi:MAG TPA: CHASE2 domain-containing protein [Candidatus Eisenbacteria bacterium]|nr:CHASE2 domain-containing protein [Candidatus Eisenbacteria bacterium]